MTTKTRAITHSSVFLRTLKARPSEALACAKLHHELLHGVAAQDAFVALFDQYDDFEELAYEAATAPIPPYQPEAPKRERQAANRATPARVVRRGGSRKRKARAPAPSSPRAR